MINRRWWVYPSARSMWHFLARWAEREREEHKHCQGSVHRLPLAHDSNYFGRKPWTNGVRVHACSCVGESSNSDKANNNSWDSQSDQPYCPPPIFLGVNYTEVYIFQTIHFGKSSWDETQWDAMLYLWLVCTASLPPAEEDLNQVVFKEAGAGEKHKHAEKKKKGKSWTLFALNP